LRLRSRKVDLCPTASRCRSTFMIHQRIPLFPSPPPTTKSSTRHRRIQRSRLANRSEQSARIDPNCPGCFGVEAGPMEGGRYRFGDEETRCADRLIAAALAEDLGQAGDITSASVIPATATGAAALIARASGILAGVPAVER